MNQGAFADSKAPSPAMPFSSVMPLRILSLRDWEILSRQQWWNLPLVMVSLALVLGGHVLQGCSNPSPSPATVTDEGLDGRHLTICHSLWEKYWKLDWKLNSYSKMERSVE